MTTQPHADPSAVQRRVSKVARDVATLLATVEQLTAERDRARESLIALEQEDALKDEALGEVWALARNARDARPVQVVVALQDVRHVLSALAARLSAHLFPTDEVCSSCGAPLDSLGCVRGEDGRPGHTTGAGCEASPTDDERRQR